MILTQSSYTTVPAGMPAAYFAEYRTGRAQPFTVWYKRAAMGKKATSNEVIGFCRTWAEALRVAQTDDPEERYDVSPLVGTNPCAKIDLPELMPNRGVKGD